MLEILMLGFVAILVLAMLVLRSANHALRWVAAQPWAVHTIAFFENQDGAGAQQNIAALADALSPLYKVGSNADKLVVDSKLRNIVGGHFYVDATVAPRAVLVAPSIKANYRGRSALPVPLLASTSEPASPAVMNDWRSQPIVLDAGEELSYETLNNPAAAVDQFAVLYVSDGPVARVDPRGGWWERFTTVASAMTANTWNSRPLTAAETLLKGRYQVLAGRALSTSLIQARLNFPLGGHTRPPIGSNDAIADLLHPMFQPGEMGILGEFDHDAPPLLEALVDLADNEVQDVYLYIRPTAARAA